MIKGIGTDIIEIDRVKDAITRTSSFINKLLTPLEQKRLMKDQPVYQSIAGVFAAKEAVSKALGTGFTTFTLTDIEILKDEKGKPMAKLYGGAQERFELIEGESLYLSISHCKAYATATAIIEGK